MTDIVFRIVFTATLGVTLIVSEARAERAVPGRTAPRVLTLDDAYRLAAKDNPTLQVMEARVQRAKAEKRRAWSRLHPTARLNGTFSYNDSEVTFDPAALAPAGMVD